MRGSEPPRKKFSKRKAFAKRLQKASQGFSAACFLMFRGLFRYIMICLPSAFIIALCKIHGISVRYGRRLGIVLQRHCAAAALQRQCVTTALCSLCKINKKLSIKLYEKMSDNVKILLLFFACCGIILRVILFLCRSAVRGCPKNPDISADLPDMSFTVNIFRHKGRRIGVTR